MFRVRCSGCTETTRRDSRVLPVRSFWREEIPQLRVGEEQKDGCRHVQDSLVNIEFLAVLSMYYKLVVFPAHL